MRIKPIQQAVTPGVAPTVRAPLGVTSGFTEGLGQMGQAISGAGNVLQDIAVRKKFVDDSVSLTDLESRANLSYAQHHDNLRQNPNYKDLDEINKEGLEAILKQYDDEARAINPEVAAAWKEKGGVRNIKAQIASMPIMRDRLRQNAIAGAFTLMNSKKAEAVRALMAGDTETANAIFQEVNEAVNFLRDNLGVPARSAEAWKEGFENEVEAEKILEETAFKRQLREAEVKADKDKKAEYEANFGDLVVLYGTGDLTEARIIGDVKNGRVDPDKGMAMLTRLRITLKDEKEPEINNAIVVGRLASDIELGIPMEDRLDRAFTDGDIKSGTYITLTAKVGDRNFKRGMGYINRALTPSQADKWTTDRHVRHAEAIDDYQTRVGQGQNPIEVAREIVDLNIGHIRRTILGLRTPRFLTGEKTNLTDLALAETITVGKYQAGEITIDEFNREAKLIKQLEDLIGELSGGESLGTEMSDRMKQSKELRKR